MSLQLHYHLVMHPLAELHIPQSEELYPKSTETTCFSTRSKYKTQVFCKFNRTKINHSMEAKAGIIIKFRPWCFKHHTTILLSRLIVKCFKTLNLLTIIRTGRAWSARALYQVKSFLNLSYQSLFEFSLNSYREQVNREEYLWKTVTIAYGYA